MCTLDNTSSASSCAACGSPLPVAAVETQRRVERPPVILSVSRAPTTDTSSWTCDACTYLNSLECHACAACHSRRPVTGSAVAPVAPSLPARAAAPAHIPAALSSGPPLPPYFSSDDGSVVGDQCCSAAEESAADAHYMSIIAHALKTGSAFCDPEFPARTVSLGVAKLHISILPPTGTPGEGVKTRVPILWRRPPDLADEYRSFGPNCTMPAPRALLNLAEGKRPDTVGDVEVLTDFSASELQSLARVVRKPTLDVREPPQWMFRSGPISGGDVSQVVFLVGAQKRKAHMAISTIFITYLVLMQGALGTCWFVSALAVVASSHSAVLRLFRDLPLIHALRLSGLGGTLPTGHVQLASMLGSPAELREFFTRRGGQIQVAMRGASPMHVTSAPPFLGDVVDLASLPLSPLGAYQV